MTKSSYYWEHGANPNERNSAATAPTTNSIQMYDGTKINNVAVATAAAALIAANNTATKNLAPQVAEVTLSSAQVLALNATPISVLAAPAAGFANMIIRVTASKAAGTAYAGIAAGEDIVIRYTDASGSIAATIEATGFLDSTALTSSRAAVNSCLPVVAAALVAHMATGEVTTGDSPVKLRIVYETVPVPVF